MSARDDGGSAFPNRIQFGPEGQCANSNAEITGGMSLRDYFAAKAMLGYLTCPAAEIAENDGRCCDLPITDEKIASLSYEMADAMLKARGA